jgi:hypothetical protein
VTRGALYMIWGDNPKVNTALLTAVEAWKQTHPDIPYHVQRMPPTSDLRCKSRMLDLSPFDVTLYLDCDTVVLGRVDKLFTEAGLFGLACCINPHPWARRYDSLHECGDMIEYDTGVVCFDRRDKVRSLFDRWKAGDSLNSRSFFMSGTGPAQMPVNDQCAFANAVYMEAFNPAILPVNYNFHPTWQKTVFGPIKIWHDYRDVPAGVRKWNDEQSAQGALLQCGGIDIK